jgi:hypothetical protein
VICEISELKFRQIFHGFNIAVCLEILPGKSAVIGLLHLLKDANNHISLLTPSQP